MKTRILLTLLLLLVGTLAFAQKTVPTCNSFDATGAPIFSSAVPPNAIGTTLCTDYFGKGNYANSPLPAGPLDVSATGFTIVNGGSGYSATPTVTVSDAFGTPTATGAVCSATAPAGLITAITCTSAGSGYVAPLVKITDTTGTGAWVLAKISAAGPLTGGMRKFMDPMPDLKGTVATADTTTFPGSDYYEIALVETTWQMHTDLSSTTVRGYVQVPSGSTGCPVAPVFKYLGPVIVAAKNRPVRIKFTNCLPTAAAGNLFIPVDTTYMGAGVGPDGVSPYLQNRATLHLHGGNTPWISDGTPHQWTIPVGETSPYARGVSTQFVPDMFFDSTGKVTAVPQCSTAITTGCWPTAVPTGLNNDPGQGSMTFYWTNQQGGRLMFYHDHAYGITRLNVYVGEAAGYYLYDPAEETALAAATAPGTVTDLGHLIPLVIQDKTFVPNAGQVAGQDPTWIWGTPAPANLNGNGNGDLWFPHVYMPNQNPADAGGANAYGRWDYGAWFYPPQTTLTAAGPGGPKADPHGGVTISCTSAAFPNLVLAPAAANNFFEGCPITPNPSGTPEGFMDTPLVNGKAYPVLHVAPEAYRFQILAAGNDRSWNLQLYVADPTGKEVPMLPAVPPATGTALPLCGTITQITQPSLGLGLPMAALDASGNPINSSGLPLNCWPNYGSPSPGIPSKQFMWPADGRDGGVPDPRYAGPPFIQIGTEGGLLPAPAVIPSTPVNYEANTRSITITNVSTHGLWLGPAERADVIVDFAAAATRCTALGVSPCTLILYNDAPTPAPAFDLRDDYFTGDIDESQTGGAPPTLPGYGPNTRTVMQIVVDQAPTATTPFSLASLQAALPAAFKATQPVPVIPEPTYPVASGGNAAKATYSRISDITTTFAPAGQPVTSITVAPAGTGTLYSAGTTVSIAPPGCAAPCATATATPTIGVGGVITAVTLTSGGSGYTTAPLVTFTDPLGLGAGATATANLTTTYAYDEKAIQELFTLDYGRMNATLGTELPLTNFQVQTTLPFGYAEWPTEIIHDGDTQVWYLTHNGVDTHFIHFHLFNVQVINRIGWDGTVRPPDQNELGWKDTVRMNPLENIVVAVRPVTPILPFPLPDSVRSLDVTMPDGVVSPEISGIDPATGNAIPGTQGTMNNKINLGWEYVWHCHILGHEENDMMRPITFQVAPPAPSQLFAQTTATGVNVTYVDNSASETSFTLEKDTDPTFPHPTPFPPLPASIPNTAFGGILAYVDPLVPPANTNVYYRVRAEDDFLPTGPLSAPFIPSPMSSAWSNVALAAPAYPTTITLTTNSPVVYGNNGLVTVTVTAAIAPVTGTVTLTVDGAPLAPQTLVSGTTTFTLVLPVVGTHNLVANYAAQGVFLASTTSGTLVVTPAALTITANNATMPYGGPIPAFTVTAAGLVLPDTLVSLSFVQACTTTATITSPVGTYPIDCSTSTIVAPNYTVTYVAGTLTVTPAALTLTANNVSKVFGAPLPTFTVTGTGFVPPDNVNSLAGMLSCTATATAASPVGTYPINCSGLSSPNYTITWVAGTLTVTPAALTITVNNATKAYGGPIPAFSVTATGLVGTDTLVLLSFVQVCTTTATVNSPVGTYPIDCSTSTIIAPNYTVTYVAGTLTVTPAALTITANNATKAYGGPIPAFSVTATGLAGADTLVSLGFVQVCTTTATVNSPVGTYPIDCSTSTIIAPNYTVAYVAGTLTVTPAALTITANNATKPYGGPIPAFSVTPTGLVGTDTLALLGFVQACTTTATVTSPVGTYPINCSTSTINAPNYTVTYVAGTLTVTPAALTLTANNATKVFGAPLPGFNVTGVGFVPPDNVNSLAGTLACTTSATATSPVGTYPINCSGLSSNNYTITWAAGTLTVTPAALTLTANNATKAYGAALPGFSVTGTGFVFPDTLASLAGALACTSTATAASAVGSYPINCLGLSSPNYAIAWAPGMLTVTPVPLTITANNATRVWGFANPVFTVSYAGFVNGDSAAALGGALVCLTTATQTSAVGTYPINCSGQTSTNYTIAYVAGTLTVTNAVQLAPPSLTFATQNVGTTSPFQTVTLRNIGGSALTTVSGTFTGANVTSFFRGGNGGGTCGATLAAGATCTINIRFRPTTSGVLTAALSVTAAGGNTGTVALTGTGNGAVAATTPASNNFGGVTRGQVSAPFNFTVTNRGTSTLTFNATGAFTLGGANPTQFVLTTGGSCVNGGTLAPLASCTFSVTFAPRAGTTLGTKNATVRVRSNATNGTQTVTVTGTAQ